MDVLGKARRRRENFEDLTLKIVDFMKEIDEMRPLKPQNFLGAFGADCLSALYSNLDYLKGRIPTSSTFGLCGHDLKSWKTCRTVAERYMMSNAKLVYSREISATVEGFLHGSRDFNPSQQLTSRSPGRGR